MILGNNLNYCQALTSPLQNDTIQVIDFTRSLAFHTASGIDVGIFTVQYKEGFMVSYNKCLRRSKSCMIIMLLPAAVLLFGQEKTVTNDGTDLSIEELINVKITVASKTEENVSDAPGVISVVTQDELKRFGGTTLADILKRVPSLLGTTVYMTDRSVIASRGDQIMPSSSHILLLLNGRPMREVMEGGIKSEIYESFPISVIERIEVIRGPGSVLYGSQAFSGVINVVTKSPENKTVAVSGALGEGMRSNVMTDLQYKIGDFGLVLAARYADKGGWETGYDAPNNAPWEPYSIEHLKLSIPDYGPGVFGDLSYKKLRLMFSYNKWDNQQFTPDFQWLKHIQPNGVDATGPATWNKFFGDLGYSLNPVKWYNTSLNLTYTRSGYKSQDFPQTLRDAYEIIGEWTNFFTPIEKLNITLGGVFGFMTGTEGDPVNKSIVYNYGHKQNNFSEYTQVDYRWKWCKAIGGMQVNKVRCKDSLGNVDNFDADVNPRAGLIFYPLEHINIKTFYSTAYRAPSIDELYLDFPTMSGKMIRHDDPHFGSWHQYTLDPEKVYTYDMGVNYEDNKIQFGINCFHSRMKNLIFQDRDTTRYAIPTWDNLGELTLLGLECEGKYYLTKTFLFEGAFLFQQSRDEKTHEDNVTPLPNFSAKGGLSYQSEYGLTVSGFNTFQQALDKKFSSDLNKTTKYFNMINVHCSYDVNKLIHFQRAKELLLVMDIDNLLDEQIWLPAWGLKPGSTIPYYEGRTIYGGINVAF
jgi:outer membrane receptor for ferrienterochelin and colicins